LAATAVERLIARIRGDTDGAPLHLSFAPELVVRRSTTRPRIVS
jgi:DNA-binding LacI/PurR family transcriptional regulator